MLQLIKNHFRQLFMRIFTYKKNNRLIFIEYEWTSNNKRTRLFLFSVVVVLLFFFFSLFGFSFQIPIWQINAELLLYEF